jgi:hypothetical protein
MMVVEKVPAIETWTRWSTPKAPLDVSSDTNTRGFRSTGFDEQD